MSLRFPAWIVIALEVLCLAGLVVATRCANYRDVFVQGNTYFTDADCYARMTRVRLCANHPGLIVRHHRFENFPEGTRPHTTAPLDYLILGLSLILRPFTSRPIDLAGAFISPVLGLLGGGFLWWWSWRLRLRFRWAMLILFCLSPILVHGTALGRPDHQSLVILLLSVAIGACSLAEADSSRFWGIVNGLAWGMAIWVSAYEPLVLLVLFTIFSLFLLRPERSSRDENNRLRLTNEIIDFFMKPHRRAGGIAFWSILLMAFLIERRLPSVSLFAADPMFKNWARSIGELSPVSLLNPIWLAWLGWLVVAAPVLIFFRRTEPAASSHRFEALVLILLGATFCLTIWQARWSYFFALFFVLALPGLLERIKWRFVAGLLFAVSLYPVLRDWDGKIWPEGAAAVSQMEQRLELVKLRELSVNLISAEVRPFLAPWWLSPAMAYWSGQPGIAGSSHESLPGIVDSAQFYLTADPGHAGQILRQRQVVWVLAYDADRVERNSAAILGRPASSQSLARILDQRPTQAPRFLIFSAQNGTAKLFQVANKW